MSQSKELVLEAFKLTTSVLNVVTSVNDRQDTPFPPMREIPRGPTYPLLRALASMLARDDEVVAVASTGYTIDGQIHRFQILAAAESDRIVSAATGRSHWEDVRESSLDRFGLE